ncbi:MAG: hypothetical protein HFE64_03930 [Lachnospiraceae bacterium]|nr:hypothetical protein [Lachnospiraceae bacterium]
MHFYHGSPIGGLNELKPFLSEHGKQYIYFSTNPVVALLYAVKPVPKPFSFYPYGFEKDGTVVYSEYFENAFYHLYNGKVGYLYECMNLKNMDNPTNINCAYTCSEPIKVNTVTEISNLYTYFKEQESKGLFWIKQREKISEQEMQFVFDELQKDMKRHNLHKFPQHPMSVFIQEHFPNVWDTRWITE